jgi:hypothetical protein
MDRWGGCSGKSRLARSAPPILRWMRRSMLRASASESPVAAAKSAPNPMRLLAQQHSVKYSARAQSRSVSGRSCSTASDRRRASRLSSSPRGQSQRLEGKRLPGRRQCPLVQRLGNEFALVGGQVDGHQLRRVVIGTILWPTSDMPAIRRDHDRGNNNAVARVVTRFCGRTHRGGPVDLLR